MKSHVRYRYASLLVGALLSLILSISAFGQSDSAQVSGFVKDASGSAVPGAQVVLTAEGSNLERRSSTNDTGYYVFSAIPPGFYTLAVEAKGFKKFQKTQNKLDPNIAATIDANLEVGAVTETVDVVATVASVQSETATIGQLIESKQIKDLQLNGRNPIYLAALEPGVRSGSSLARFGFGLDSGGFNINGGRSQDVLITQDGAVGIRTRSNGTSIGTADVDAVQEVQVLTANYNAEYGRANGGQIRIVTKSGTRDFHGDLYEYFRNSALNANSWSRNRTIGRLDISGAPDPFRYNQFGYDVNGPLFIPKVFNRDRSKLFFLFSEEWVRQRAGSTAITVVPSLAMRTGDFSELLNPTNQLYGSQIFIRDPLKTGACSVADQTACFMGNVIGKSRLSANGLAMLNAYPLPTPGFAQGRNNFIQQRPTLTNQSKKTISIDYNPSEKQQFRFRNLLYNFYDVSAFRANTDRAPQIINRPNQTFSLNHVYTFSPTLINEFLGSFSRDQVYIAVDTRSGNYRRSIYGINYPYIFPNGKEITDKIPTVKIDNFTDLDGGPYPSSSVGPVYDVSDNLTKIRGNHTFKAGFLFERAGENDFDQINVSGIPGGTNNQNGSFEFRNSTPNATNNAAANVALGLFNTYAEIGNRSFTPYRGHMYEWFVQDSWKASSKLRIELGLRHTIVQPYYSLWGNMDVFDIKSYDPAKAAAIDSKTGNVLTNDLQSRFNGIVIPGNGPPAAGKGRVPALDSGQYNFLFRGYGKSYSNIHFKDFQPRLGIAYSLNNKTVVRAGAGRFFTRLGVSDSVFLGGNSPFQPQVSVSNGQADNPGGGAATNFPLYITSQDPDFPNPSAYTWNATVQRELSGSTVISVGYVGRKGLHQQRERNINQLQPGTIQANPGINENYLRPYKGFSTIRVTNNDASSFYNGLQVSLNRRFSHGLNFGVAYTLSKVTDNGSGQRDVLPNAFDGSALWGPSTYDTRHVLVITYIYELPFLKGGTGLASKILGNWELSGVTQFQTGTPGTVATGDDFAGVGSGSGSQIYNVNGDWRLSDPKFSNGAADQNFYIRTTNPDGTPIFTKPAPGTFTNQRVRDLFYGPGFQNWNIGLFKKFYTTEKQFLTFRFEAFNFINHPNLGGDNGGGLDLNPNSGTFGKVTSKGGQRTLQLSLRYTF